MSISLRKHKRRAAAGMERRFTRWRRGRAQTIAWYHVTPEQWAKVATNTAGRMMPCPHWYDTGGWKHHG